MNERVAVNDGLVNVLANLGTARDKATHVTYAFVQRSHQELLAAYRSAWLPRKVVDIPAHDATRRWRSWNADKNQITAIEAVETRLQLKRKMRDLIIAGRLYGGAALYISTGTVDVDKPFDPLREQVRHLTLLPKQMFAASRHLLDLDSVNFGQPELYTVSNGSKQVNVHHTRLVRWIGASVPVTDVLENDGWGDSVLVALFDAISQSDATAGNIASLVYEAKVDILHIPRLMELMKTKKGEQQVRTYLETVMSAKSLNGALVLDGGDTSQPDGKTGGVRYDSKTQSFSGLDAIWDRALQAVAGAADIPATRLLGQSPAGMNATGESDLRNYYDRIQSMQELDVQSAMALLDQAIVVEATGGPMDDIYYNWRSLWQTTDKEQADLGKTTIDILTAMKDTGLWPDEVLAEAGSNAMIETNAVPGLEAALDDYGDYNPEDLNAPPPGEVDLTQPPVARPDLRVVSDAPQLRVPAGSPRGGQWTKVGAAGSSRLRGEAATEEEISAVGDYIQEASELNLALRTSGIPRHREDEVELLDGLIARSQLTADTDLYRGLTPEAFKAISPQKGKTFEDKAFVSTSRSKKRAQEFSENFASGEMGYVMRIFARKGTSAADVSELTGDHAEQEVLLPRGQKFKVMDVNESRREIYVHAV